MLDADDSEAVFVVVADGSPERRVTGKRSRCWRASVVVAYSFDRSCCFVPSCCRSVVSFRTLADDVGKVCGLRFDRFVDVLVELLREGVDEVIVERQLSTRRSELRSEIGDFIDIEPQSFRSRSGGSE